MLKQLCIHGSLRKRLQTDNCPLHEQARTSDLQN